MAIKAKSAQDFVPIKEIHDGVVVLKDGSLRAVVLANSVNLSLKSADEQRAILLQFQSFLNTLEFSTQISIQSRRLDIRPYLLTLEARLKDLKEPLLKLQTKEYIDFIMKFTDSVSIMTKSFFVVVPYAHISLKQESDMFMGLFSKKPKGDEKLTKQAEFEEQRSQLEQRVNVIQQGLASCGIKSAQLGTEEIVEMFYKVFNPGEQEGKIHLENQL